MRTKNLPQVLKLFFIRLLAVDKITILGQFLYRGFNSRIAKSELNKINMGTGSHFELG